MRPRPRPRPKKWSWDHTGLETLTSLLYICVNTHSDISKACSVKAQAPKLANKPQS